MTEKEFLTLLAEVVTLQKEAHMYNTTFVYFDYKLTTTDTGGLILTTSHPLGHEQIETTISLDHHDQNKINSMFLNTIAFIKRKRNNHST